MSATQRARLAPKYRFLTFVLALAVGCLGANPFADTAGWPAVQPGQHPGDAIAFRVLGGFLVGLVALALLRLLVQQSQAVTDALSRTTTKPGQVLAVTLVVCGTLCLLGTLVLEWYLVSSPVSLAQAASISGLGGGAAQVVLSVQAPLLGHLAAMATFLAGMAQIALGVWSSIHPGVPQATDAVATSAAAAASTGHP